MFLLTTAAQRDIIKVALVNQKKLANDLFSVLKRLGESERPALKAQGIVEYLIDEFEKMNVGERDQKKWDLQPDGAKMLRAALGNWARQALARSEAAAQLSLTTNVSKQETEAQQLLNQLNDQLSLPLIDIGAYVEQMEEKPEAKEPVDMATDRDVQPAPHRGRRSSAGSDSLVLDINKKRPKKK
jgi:hypothetical protein